MTWMVELQESFVSRALIRTLSALSFQRHAVTASVRTDSEAKPVRSPTGKVRSLCDLVGKGHSREVRRIIPKSKGKVGVSRRDLDMMKLELHLGSRWYISLFSWKSCMAFACHLFGSLWNTFFFFLNIENSCSALKTQHRCPLFCKKSSNTPTPENWSLPPLGCCRTSNIHLLQLLANCILGVLFVSPTSVSRDHGAFISVSPCPSTVAAQRYVLK